MSWNNPNDGGEAETGHDPGRPRSLALAVIGLAGTGCLALAIFFSSCGVAYLASGPIKLAGRKLDEAVEHGKGPVPEAEWNESGVWRRISNDPPTYLPIGYRTSLPRDERAGVWVLDQRDGKRLFVPNEGVGGYSHNVLMAEAHAATNWRFRSRISVSSLYSDNEP